MASSSSGGISLPKWQIALAVGATSAVGLCYWYMRQQSKDSKKHSLGDKKQSISLDETFSQDVSTLTPLQLAQKYKNDGNVLFKKGKYDEAIGLYNKAIEACPEDCDLDLSTFYQNRAAAYEHLKKWSSVIADCSTALEKNPGYEKALYRRSKAYEATKEYENCLDDITAVCLIQNFQNQHALVMADRVLKEIGKEHAAEAIKNRKPKLPSKQFVKTYFLSFSEDPVYNFIINTDFPVGENPTGFLKAKLSFATENYDEIIPACTEEINSSEAESNYIMEALSLRASFYLLSGAHKQAFEDLKAIIDSKDADVKIKVNALIKRASLNMQLENTLECLQDFEEASTIGENISDVFHHRGQVHILLDNTEAARKDFKKAIELNPDFAIAFVQKCYADYRHAIMSQSGEMLVKVMNDFRKATQKYTDCSEVFVLFAQVLTERQEYEDAEKLYFKAIEIDPGNATILIHQGLLYLQWKSDIEKSVELMRTAIKLDDMCEFAYETLGTVEVQRGNLIIAVELFEKAICLARTEMEMTHLFSLKDAAASQLRVTTKLGLGPKLLRTD